MRNHAIRIIEEHRSLIDTIVKPPLDFEENHNQWLLVPEDGSKPYVVNHETFYDQFPGASKHITIQVVR